MVVDNMSADYTTAPEERRITVDAEHFSVRFLVPVLMIAATLLTHIVGLSVLRGAIEGANPECLVLPLDAVVFLSVGFLAERVLKRLMPSRRYATLSPDALVIRDERQSPPTVTRVDWDRTINALGWRFAVRRRTRVPKGWFCLAIQLLQDETSIILYTFMSPDEAKTLPGYDNFTRLRPRKETASNTDLRAVAEQRRLLKLEDERWDDGAEIGADDFRAVLRHVPGWT